MCNAPTMLRSAPDDAKDVAHDIQLHAERRQRQNRLIIAIILQSFRSSDRSDMVFTIEHLIRLEYPGDKNMLLNLRKEDTPREIALRDILYHKIKGWNLVSTPMRGYRMHTPRRPTVSF